MFSNKKRTQKRSPRTLKMEPLEQRTVFAGNVILAFSPANADLLLIGDSANNSVSIQPNGGGGVSVVGRQGTTVNGLPSQNFAAAQLGTITSMLDRGSDSISIVDLVFSRLDLQETLGDDNVNLENVRVIGNVSINSALGDDDIRIDGLIQGSAIIDSGKGNDRVSVSGRIGVPLDSMGNLRDGYVFGTLQTGLLGINTGLQKDKVSLTSLDVDGHILIDTGSHDDEVRTDLVRSIFIDLQTDQGDDKVSISRTKAFQISASLGAGSDLLKTDLATITSVPMFFMNGGTGVDTLDRNGNVGGIAVGFEILI